MRWLEALRAWAMSDRIRASPRDGKLLRLPVGACVRIGDTVTRVTGRTVVVGGGEDRAEITYRCQSAIDDFEMLVALSSTTPPALRVRIVRNARMCDVSVQE